jgi:ABC-type glycerol-3-phosphate transport system substrate-binding protein
MKVLFSKFNINWIAILILFTAFIYSAYRFYATTQELSSSSNESGQKIIRVTHWQLEPGFREAFQWMIDEYEALPRVKAANVRIIQAPVPVRVYNQFMNVHLISGTAPDIAVKGGTALISGSALAKFYAPLGSYIEEPNPYNADEYLPRNLPKDEVNFLSTAPWRDTFFDGLYGGYDENLSDYYGIPVSATGGMRIFYNVDMLRSVKAFVRNELEKGSDSEWLQQVWRSAQNENGYLPRASGVKWLYDSSIPQTLGQFYLYCYAIQAYARATGNDYLVPIAGSSYAPNDLSDEYKKGFLSDLNAEQVRKMDAIEMLANYERGLWSFESREFQEFLNFVEATASFYPKGYLGLDREQAQRRFVLGLAGIIRTGGWDASSILSGVAKRDNPADQFEVEIAPAPLPAKDERWADLLPMRVSEADVSGRVPFAINKQSKNFDWALDFLQFATSLPINQEFNKRAGWLPVTIGAKAPESVAAFSPILGGYAPQLTMDFADIGDGLMLSSIRSAWNNNLKLLATGEIDRKEMIDDLTRVLNNPNIGIPKAWKTRHQLAVDGSRAYNRSITIERLSSILGNEAAIQREQATMSSVLTADEGIMIEQIWHDAHPDEPFPAY